VDAVAPLESIANALPSLPPEAVESMLVTFDTLASLCGEVGRGDAARLLRDAAARCSEASVKARLLSAADRVAAGEPCALTPDGLTGRQAAAANTITAEEWQARGGDASLPQPPPPPAEPPALPHLSMRHFFPGLLVHVAREFSDADGLVVPAGERMHFSSYKRTGRVENTLTFRERKLRLLISDPAHHDIVENQNNQWLKPVPSIECLKELWKIVDERLRETDFADSDAEVSDAILNDMDDCQVWLFEESDRGFKPQCSSGPKAVELFGAGTEMAVWVPFLFAGVAAALPDA
jgi:hypothetical protein